MELKVIPRRPIGKDAFNRWLEIHTKYWNGALFIENCGKECRFECTFVINVVESNEPMSGKCSGWFSTNCQMETSLRRMRSLFMLCNTVPTPRPTSHPIGNLYRS